MLSLKTPALSLTSPRHSHMSSARREVPFLKSLVWLGRVRTNDLPVVRQTLYHWAITPVMRFEALACFSPHCQFGWAWQIKRGYRLTSVFFRLRPENCGQYVIQPSKGCLDFVGSELHPLTFNSKHTCINVCFKQVRRWKTAFSWRGL